ncbi:DNA-binding response regulator [Arenimonas maotaiensis]|uniref:DNA-binding response regulator n=1 Tax=Arenimonas maotaiensis TaxID=1446479 RepID=A0A917CRJ9_9GAMM|nr:LytTR family DNA-binding domain-containing protein [Arenimonas maotaiensis]GGF95551.1 DNA-binding response regulator [Arenimonas maotaiensis]
MTRPLSVLVVDDEPLAVERLCALLAEMPDCALAGVAGNTREAWQLAQRLLPDVVLLDIAMPGESGLELAGRLATLPKPPAVVFCTAFGQHALQAFDAQAIDYLLKPVRRERLADSLARARRLISISVPPVSEAFVAATVGGVIRRIALADIRYLHADDKYTVAHHQGGEHVLDQTLKELEQQFPAQLVRIHRNCLVNRAQLQALRRDADGHVWALLKDIQRPLEVSRRCAGELKDWFKGG